MAPSPRLRKLLAFALTWSLVVTGLTALTTQRGRASEKLLPPTPPANAAAPEKQPAPKGTEVDEATRARVTEAYSKLPLSFEENRGQVDAEVKYLARGQGYTLFLTPTEAVLSLRRAGAEAPGVKGESRRPRRRQPAPRAPRPDMLRMKLRGANRSPDLTGESEAGARVNYFKGNDPKKWRTNVARFGRVRYAQVYAGVDVVYYGEHGQLEYDFEVAPGADAQQVVLEFAGTSRVKVERATGDLVLKTAGGEVRQRRPAAYQEVGGERREVLSRYVMRGAREVGIEVGEYDRTRPLVIDPVLSYSTYLGAELYDVATDIAVDSSGMAYVVGWSDLYGFPVRNEYQTYSGDLDAFVTKLDPNRAGAASLLYSTYLGGTGGEYGHGIAVDSSGKVYVTGETYSDDFPTKNGFQTNQPLIDGFVVKLDTNLAGAASFLYGTYLGGSDFDYGYSIAANSSGVAYVTGGTWSSDFPTKNGFQANHVSFLEAFVTKLDTNQAGAASLLYSTYLGGNGLDEGLDIAIDPAGIVYLTGYADSTNFPTLNQYQQGPAGPNAFITKLDTNVAGAGGLLYSTYLGGTDFDWGLSIAVDAAGVAYVAGWTNSPDFPTVNEYQTYQGNGDAFVAKVDTNLSGTAALLYSTYLGGSDKEDEPTFIGFRESVAVDVDTAGNVYVCGMTASPDFPRLNEFPAHQNDEGRYDAFVAKLNPRLAGAASLLFSTNLGGTNDDFGQGIAVDSSGGVYVTGSTSSADFPLRKQYQGQQSRFGGFTDGFVTKLIITNTISGRVTSDGATGIRGVTLTLSGSQDRSAVTDASGFYSFRSLPSGGDYTVTASKDGLTLIAPRRNFTDLEVNQTDVDFTTRRVTVGGSITTGAGAALGGVTVTLTGGANFTPRVVTTSSYGTYSFNGLPTPGNYRVTPSKTNYNFSPAQAVLFDVAANQPGTDFTASLKTYTVGGAVRYGGLGLGGVTVRLESQTPDGFATRATMTDGEGRYSFPNVPAGRNYIVTPAKLGYQFAPSNQSLAGLSANQTGVNFSVLVYSVGGRVTRAGTTNGLGAVTVTLTSPVPAGFPARTAQTNSLGYYLFTNLPAGRNYTLKPSKTGFTFSPAEHDVAKLSGHVPAGTSTSFTGTGP